MSRILGFEVELFEPEVVTAHMPYVLSSAITPYFGDTLVSVCASVDTCFRSSVALRFSFLAWQAQDSSTSGNMREVGLAARVRNRFGFAA